MEEAEINKLFMQVAACSGPVPEDVRRVFAALVATTLTYRDHMKQMQVTVTVADVQQALDMLLAAMSTGSFPQTADKIQSTLVYLWLDALKPYR